jgi:hypothetical protein
MENPQEQVTSLRDRLINRLIDLDAKLRDLQSFYSLVKEKEYIETINICPQFFRMHTDSLLKDIIIVLAKTFDNKSKRSIYTLLDWLDQCIKNLNYKGDPITYVDISDFHTDIMNVETTLTKIKKQRDKFLAHDDKKYFDQPFRIHEEAPIDLSELEIVLKVLRSILFRIYGAMENSHYIMQITDLKKADYVIKLLRHHSILYKNEKISGMMFSGELPYP